MRTALLLIAIASLFAGLWFAWDHFQGRITREHLLTLFGVCSLIWFVCATAWAYMKPGVD